ncbi:hypothetical protein AHF37_03555 [Paragonimus kellicotti]|nr:hypothetical protein AHF37_03555 [Paragonimus kellicotti]
MDLPDHILERVFLYLSWNDRARAARVCRKWLNVFRSPPLWRRIVFTPPTRPLTRLQYDVKGYRTSCWNDRARAARVCRKWLNVFRSPPLWRRIVFTPPTRPLTRLQYDVKGYRTSCCLRAIGSYVREVCFVKSEDIFLLNRNLSLIAKYLETNPIQRRRPSKDVDIHTISTALDYRRSAVDSTDDDTEDVNIYPVQSVASDATEEPLVLLDDLKDPTPSGTERFSDYVSCITGDPDAEATLRLVMKLQEREFHLSSSDASSDEADMDLNYILSDLRSASLSLPKPSFFSGRQLFKRSQSFRHSCCAHPRQSPPSVRGFVLDFHCEVDDARGFAYGTGGALLSTIRRVVRQLFYVERLHLTDLFLTATDARDLILDLHKTVADSLRDLNVVHFNKLSSDVGTLVGSAVPVMPPSLYTTGRRDWYLLDPRWLGARPRRLHQNPLADLASLFPQLRRLTIAPTQLSDAMLLRLLYQTRLLELVLVLTDYTPFTIRHSPQSGYGDFGSQARIPLLLDSEPNGNDHLHYGGDEFDDDDDLIDWGDDVPRFKDQVGLITPLRAGSSDWRPISSSSWRAALILRPQLFVQLKIRFLRVSAEDTTATRVASLLAFWPEPPCPVCTFVFNSVRGPRFAALFLSLTNVVNFGNYASSLTTVIISLEAPSTDQSMCYPEETKSDSADEWKALNDIFRDLPASCPSLSLLALGGTTTYLSIPTLFVICRHYGRRLSLPYASNTRRIRLVVGEQCCRFDDSSPNNVPATVLAWYSTVTSAGKDVGKRKLAAERCIAHALMQPRWCFLTSAQFQSELADYLN